MASGRKTGPTHHAKAKNQLSLGDLVLAKLRGFPAWPAKISRPEDWDQTPDPKKYFVRFFGTAENAFVAPADIQAFTNEGKSRVTACLRGRRVKYLDRAVKEICEAFKELQENSGNYKEDGGRRRTAPSGIPSSADGRRVELKYQNEEIKQKVSMHCGKHGDEASGMRRLGVTASQDIKPSISYKTEPLSPDLYVQKRKKVSNINARSLKREIVSKSKKDYSSPLKEECPGDRGGEGNEVCFKVDMTVTQSKSPTLYDAEEDSMSGLVGKNTCSPPLAVSTRIKHLGTGSKEITNACKLATVVTVSKEKGEYVVKEPKRMHSSLKSLKGDDSECYINLPECGEFHSGIQSKSIPSGFLKESSSETLQPDRDVSTGKKMKSSVKDEKFLVEGDNSHGIPDLSKGTLVISEEVNEKRLLSTGDQLQLIDRKHKLAITEDLRNAKRSRHMNVSDDTAKKVISKIQKNDSPSSDIVDRKGDKRMECDKFTCQVKSESCAASRTEKNNVGTNRADEDVHHHHALESVSESATQAAADVMVKKADFFENGMSRSNCDGSPVMRRRSIRQFDGNDDDDEQYRAQVHVETTSVLKNLDSDVLDPVHNNDEPLGSPNYSTKNTGDSNVETLLSARLKDYPFKERISSLKLADDSLALSPRQREEKRPKGLVVAHVFNSPRKSEYQKPSSNENKHILVIPEISMPLATATKIVEYKAIRPQAKACGSATLRKHQAESIKGSGLISASSEHSSDQLTTQKGKPTSSGEKLKNTPLADSQMNSSVVSSENSKDSDPSLGICFAESVTSMRHLIAAAQAKRRESHVQPLSHDNTIPAVSTASVVQVRSPIPASGVLPLSSNPSNGMRLGTKELYAERTSTSPSSRVQQIMPQHQMNPEEFEEGRVSSGYRAHRELLSCGGTEASVAREALEGMLETLTRTKESIGRATRLAIDCAKHDIASEIVELLIQKLENEQSFHRKVDLFFLVDSITQCSHSQKGIAGASYIPTVQAILPRLLRAAAPPGSGAHENRRQCLKVLRLWLERKILPESLLRRYMEEIEVPNDDASTSAGFFLRRPSRAERGVDDPIREMKGMFVDEYGSNATFQLPGLSSSHIFEDEEDHSSGLCTDTGDEFAVESGHVIKDLETCEATASDRHHCILEDVDGELEMEDVSGYVKNERSIGGSYSFISGYQGQSSDKISEMVSSILPDPPPLPMDSPPLPLDFPPLPLDSPPPLPPLPPSPTPPPPPPPLSPPPSTPPPPTVPIQPSPPPVLLSPGHQPSLALQPLMLPQQPGPSLLTPHPSLLAPHPSVPSLLTHHPSMPSSSSLLCQLPLPVPEEHFRASSGSQHLQVAGNAPKPSNVAAALEIEILPWDSPSSTDDPSEFTSIPFKFGRDELFLSPRASQPNQQFQPGNVPFVQRPYDPVPLVQITSNHLSYTKPTVQHPLQQHYPHPSSFPSLTNGRRQYPTDDHWRVSTSDCHLESQRLREGGVAAPHCIGPPFVQKGFSRSLIERTSINNMGFQVSVQNHLASVAPIPGHVPSKLLQRRSDISALNNWRTT